MSDADLFGSIFKKGDVIFEQDKPGNTLFIIQSGVVEISCRRGGEKIVLSLMEKGEFFGEMALIDTRPRSATATALSRTRLLSIRRESFLNRANHDTSIIFQLLKSLCQRIERTNRLLRSLVMSDEALRAAVVSHLWPSIAVLEKAHDSQACAIPPEDNGTPLVELLRPSNPESISSDGQLAIVHYGKGETIFKEGDFGEEMFVVVDGEVRIYTEAAGQKILLNQLEAGDFFGEMALVTGNSRTATAVALKDTHLMALNNEQLIDNISARPEMALFIVQVLIARLRAGTVALESPEWSMEIVRHIISPVFKKKEKVRIALISLSSCGGCTAALIQNRTDLSVLTDIVDIVYCPMLMDAESFREADIALVDGAVRVREDEQLLLEARGKSRFLVAWGTCAAFGGIPAMANQYEIEELFEESYGQATDPFSYYMSEMQKFDTSADSIQKSELLRKIRKLDDIVRVDYFLPGCPPQVSLVTELIKELKGVKSAVKVNAIVCAECPRKYQNNKPLDMWAFPKRDVKNNVCLVSQGALCLGLITKGGCGAVCLQGGLPCWGCRGPMQKAIGDMNHGSFYEDLLIGIIARRSKLDADKLRSVIRLLRQKGGSALSFDDSFVKDASRLR